MKRIKLFLALFVFSCFFIGCSQAVIPEMQECMDAHGSLKTYSEVIKKYASPELFPDITICCALENSRIIHTEKKGNITYYFEEGTLAENCNEIPSGSVQIVKVGWKDKQIVSLDFLGPMKCNEVKYTKSAEAKANEKAITR